MISHESIYARIRADDGGELRSHCRHRLRYRRHKEVARRTKVKNIPNRVSIHDRPSEAAVRLLYPYRRNILTITTNNGSEFSHY